MLFSNNQTNTAANIGFEVYASNETYLKIIATFAACIVIYLLIKRKIK